MTESNQTTTDQRVVAAREFLTGARRRRVAELPPSVLAREDAELRRVLGQMLDVVADFEDEALDLDVTQLTIAGGAVLAPADVLVLRNALADALAWRQPAGGTCADCDQAPGGLCPDHVADEQAATEYASLAAALGIEVQR